MKYHPLTHAAGLLESVVAGRVTAQAALTVWPFGRNQKSSHLADSWTRLRHFADDQDLLLNWRPLASHLRHRSALIALVLSSAMVVGLGIAGTSNPTFDTGTGF